MWSLLQVCVERKLAKSNSDAIPCRVIQFSSQCVFKIDCEPEKDLA